MKSVLIIVFFIFMNSASASWMESSVLIERNSEMQVHIDNAFLEIFNSPLQISLCNLFGNPQAIYQSLGTSTEGAIKIASVCGNASRGSLSKAFTKQYYVAQDDSQTLDSWTDSSNRTFLFLNKDTKQEQLKRMLLHELAIIVDAKSGMTFPSFSLQTGQRSSAGTLSSLFNLAQWSPASITFAALRAINVENIFFGKPYITESHNQCSLFFREIFNMVKKMPTPPPELIQTHIVDLLSSTISSNFAPQNSEEQILLLEKILQNGEIINDQNGSSLSFCQYMSRPLLTSSSARSFFAKGPRPRLTGGSGGGQNNITMEKDIALQRTIQLLQKDFSRRNDIPQKSSDLENFCAVNKCPSLEPKTR